MTDDEIKTLLFRVHNAHNNFLSAVLSQWQVIEYEANPEENRIDSQLTESQVKEIMEFLNTEKVR